MGAFDHGNLRWIDIRHQNSLVKTHQARLVLRAFLSGAPPRGRANPTVAPTLVRAPRGERIQQSLTIDIWWPTAPAPLPPTVAQAHRVGVSPPGAGERVTRSMLSRRIADDFPEMQCEQQTGSGLFGALAASAALPFKLEAFEGIISAGGRGVVIEE